jgi:hypothetical protein
MLIERVVGPGAEILLKSIEPYDPELTPSTLSTEQWVKLADAFHNWHFKPDVLEDETFIKDDLVEDYQNARLFPVSIPEGVFSSVDENEDEDEDDDDDDDDLEEEIFEEHEKQ